MVRRPFRSAATWLAAGLAINGVSAQEAVPREGESAAKNRKPLDTVIVSASREEELLSETPASIGVLNEDAVRSVGATHPQQILSQVPGVAVSVTNGEGPHDRDSPAVHDEPAVSVPRRWAADSRDWIFQSQRAVRARTADGRRHRSRARAGQRAVRVGCDRRHHQYVDARPATTAGLGAALDVGSFGWRRLMLEADTGEGACGRTARGANLTHTDGWRDNTAYDRQSVEPVGFETNAGVHAQDGARGRAHRPGHRREFAARSTATTADDPTAQQLSDRLSQSRSGAPLDRDREGNSATAALRHALCARQPHGAARVVRAELRSDGLV